MHARKIAIEVAAGPASNPQPKFRPVQAVYDPQVATMTIPRRLAKELGLRKIGHRKIRVGRKETRVELVGPIWVQVANRRAYTDVIVRPGSVRVGFSPRVEMDLVVKESGQLEPRDPNGIVYFVPGSAR